MIFSSHRSGCCCPGDLGCSGLPCGWECLDDGCDGVRGYRCFNIFDEFDTCEEEDCRIACGYSYGGGIGLIRRCDNCFPLILPPTLCDCEDEDDWDEVIYFPYKCVSCSYFEEPFNPNPDSPTSPTGFCARASFEITSGTDFGEPIFNQNDSNQWGWTGGTGGYGGFGINNYVGKTPCPLFHPDTGLPLKSVEYCGCQGCTSPPIPDSGSLTNEFNEEIPFTSVGVNLCSGE